ncbi:MAG TPA: hypothetical protein ENK29_05065 [Chromatiales bacterium]|nr:hypothetical protein [Chromatiales bacterium]
MKSSTAHVITGKAQYRIGNIFFQSNIEGSNAGWFINIQGGNVYGPFREKCVAESILEGLLRKDRERRASNGH